MYFRKEKFDKIICQTFYTDSDTEMFIEKTAQEYIIIDLQITSGGEGANTILLIVRDKK